jgi:hypothetical protein
VLKANVHAGLPGGCVKSLLRGIFPAELRAHGKKNFFAPALTDYRLTL